MPASQPSEADFDRAFREVQLHALGLAQAWQALRRVGCTTPQLRLVQTANRSFQRGCARLRLGSLQRRAHELDIKLADLLHLDSPTDAELVALEAALSALSSSALALDLRNAMPFFSKQDAANERQPAPTPAANRLPMARTVCLLRADRQLAAGIDVSLRERGFKVIEHATPADLALWISAHIPAAAIIDARYLHALSQQLSGLRARPHSDEMDAAVVVVSNRRDLGRKLLATRSGAKGYFEEPFDPLDLMASLGLEDGLSARSTRRAVIVPATQAEGEEWGRWLIELGISTRIEQDLARVETALRENAAHMLIIDQRIPSGLPLAKVESLKSNAQWQHLPIIVVGGKNDLSMRERAISVGADEYLLDPVKPRHLLSVARARLERHARLRQMVASQIGQNDSPLTSARQLLDLAAARRGEGKSALLVVAMDELKTLGNHLGFTALSDLHVQLSDVVSRCVESGDLVASMHDGCLMLSLERDDDAAVMEVGERIRSACEESRFRAGDRMFTIKVSCGLSRVLVTASIDDSLKAAQKALALADRLGGNRCMWQQDMPHSARDLRPSGDVAVLGDWKSAVLQLSFQPLLPITGRLTGQFAVRPTFELAGGALTSAVALEQAAARRNESDQFARQLLSGVLDARRAALQRGKQTRLLLEVSAALLDDQDAAVWLKQSLDARKLAGPGLSLVFSSEDCATRPDAFVRLSEHLKGLGIRMGISGFGRDAALVHQLRGLKPDFIVLHEGCINTIELETGHKDVALSTLLRRIREAGSVCVATNVNRTGQLEVLRKLRVDYMLSDVFGPASKQPDFAFAST